MHFKNKTVFITGGSRGIGLDIAKKLASEGANIVIAAKTSEPHPKLPGTIHSAAAEIEAAGGKALACMVDIRDENQVLEAVKKAVDTFGGIDILINNASAIQLTGTLSTEMKKYDLAIQVMSQAPEKQSADWHNLMGFSLRLKTPPQLAMSEAHYQAALKINPMHLGALEY